MADAKIEQPAAGSDAIAGYAARQQQLQQFLFHLQPELEALAYDTHALSIWDCEAVMSALASKLFSYDGPMEGFEEWATKTVVYEAERYKILESILKAYSRVIHSAIRRGMAMGGAVDYSIEHQDIYWQVAGLIFQKAHGLMKSGSAKLSTRLTALVLKHIRFYYTSRNDRRHRLNRERLETGLPYGVEIEELKDFG